MTYYAVHIGHNQGIFMSWEAHQKAINGYSGAVYKTFNNILDAEQFVLHGPAHAPAPAPAPLSLSLPLKEQHFALPVKICHHPGQPIPSNPNPAEKLLDSLYLKYKSHASYNPGSDCVHIYTDGATNGNGKADATGGYGVFIPETSNTKEKLITRKLVNGKITNNIAELKAIIKALEEIIQMNKAGLNFIIHYDSTYAADVITGKKNGRANIELVTQGKTLLAECKDKFRVEFEHVYSHTGKQDLHSIGNEIADKLAGL